jgi:RNA polymerase-interacting CarD/CdnL/TRCF family regulator
VPGSLESIDVGDALVYASHGIGHVTRKDHGREDQAEAVTLQLAQGLSVTLPLDRALECLRAPSSETEIGDIQRTLRAQPSTMDDSWRLRMKATKEKVVAGAAVELAEVIRDSAHREPQLTARGGLRELSLAERQLYLKARHLLADEIAESRGIDSGDADEWISVQLEQAPGWPVATER